jgi:hypothetical protein
MPTFPHQFNHHLEAFAQGVSMHPPPMFPLTVAFSSVPHDR